LFQIKIENLMTRVLSGSKSADFAQRAVEFHFPTMTVLMMSKMPFMPDPRHALDKEKSYEVHRKISEDVSMTWRAPYPQEREIGLPRHKMR
jgi:DNA polymerase-3 subunit alpha